MKILRKSLHRVKDILTGRMYEGLMEYTGNGIINIIWI